MSRYRFSPYAALFAALTLASFSIIIAHVLEYIGYKPCPMCLEQRLPYYAGIPILMLLNIMVAIGIWRKRALMSCLTYLTIALFVYGAFLGLFHSGVEWGYWDGPASCGMISLPQNPSVNSLLEQIRNTGFVSCNTPVLTFFGLSLAAMNALVSVAVAALLLKFEWRSDVA